MEWVETLKDVNYVAVLVATAAMFVVGMTWYSTSMFGKTWMKELGIKEKDMNNKEGMAKAMTHSGVASFITASVLSALLIATATTGWADGALFGAVIGFGIAMTSMVTHDAFSKSSMVLTRINGMHDIVKFAVMGAILGGFGF